MCPPVSGAPHRRALPAGPAPFSFLGQEHNPFSSCSRWLGPLPSCHCPLRRLVAPSGGRARARLPVFFSGARAHGASLLTGAPVRVCGALFSAFPAQLQFPMCSSAHVGSPGEFLTGSLGNRSTEGGMADWGRFAGSRGSSLSVIIIFLVSFIFFCQATLVFSKGYISEAMGINLGNKLAGRGGARL